MSRATRRSDPAPLSPARRRRRRGVLVLVLATVAPLALASDAFGQACIGVPGGNGTISVQLDATAGNADPSYGGRLAMNFNTPFALEAALYRPRSSFGIGTAISAVIAYEMLVYEPAMCPIAGLRHEIRRVDGGEERTRMVPLGFGIGKRLGSASGLSFSIFARPEYLYVIDREGPEGEAALERLGDRSEGRGLLGLVLASPFLYASGAVEVGTIDDYEPRFNVGIGMTF